jgi:hypothetical protein
MKEHVMTNKRIVGTLAAVAAGAFVLGACGGEVRAERQGRQVGAAICDIADADSLDDASQQLDQAQRAMDDVQRIVGRPIEEDVEDIEENLDDLVEHVQDGDDALLEQDIAVIQRNAEAVGRTLSGEGEAAYDGIQQGLAECDY